MRPISLLRFLKPRQRRDPVAHGVSRGMRGAPNSSSAPPGAASGTWECAEFGGRGREACYSGRGRGQTAHLRRRDLWDWETYWGALGPPRLHRGLHDRARYAGFSVCTPGVQPGIGDMLSPVGERLSYLSGGIAFSGAICDARGGAYLGKGTEGE